MRLLQKFIYHCCYFLYKVTVKLSHPEVKDIWYRNSLCFDYWVFLRSDIDITIVFEKATKKLVEEVNYTHALFRRYLPIIGELVIFSEAHKLDLLTCVNGYELQRDPMLMEKYHLSKKPDHYEKIIFLHKFIASNWSKKNINTQRSSKIDFVLRLLDLDESKSFISLIDQLSSLLGVEPVEFKKSYMAELDNRQANVIYHSFEIPNVIYALFYNNLCYLKPDVSLNIVERKIVEKNILWELWGFFSYQTSTTSRELEDHKVRLLGHLDQLTSPEFYFEIKNLLARFELR